LDIVSLDIDSITGTFRPPVSGIRPALKTIVSRADELQQRVEEFADLSIRFVQGLPDQMIARRMGAQLLDASTSVGANHRAARRGKSHDDFAAKVGTVSEEADECVYWLKRLANARIASTVPLAPLLDEAEQLAKIFAASARTARGRRRKKRPGDPPAR
jgi:four helix bundle protein